MKMTLANNRLKWQRWMCHPMVIKIMSQVHEEHFGVPYEMNFAFAVWRRWNREKYDPKQLVEHNFNAGD